MAKTDLKLVHEETETCKFKDRFGKMNCTLSRATRTIDGEEVLLKYCEVHTNSRENEKNQPVKPTGHTTQRSHNKSLELRTGKDASLIYSRSFQIPGVEGMMKEDILEG